MTVYESRAKSLCEMAIARYSDNISALERAVIAEAVGGEQSAQPDTLSSISVEFIKWICTDTDAAELISPPGIFIRHLLIEEELDLNSQVLLRPITFVSCQFKGAFSMQGATLKSLSFENCRLQDGIRARSATFQGSLKWHGEPSGSSFTICDGGADFSNCNIDGQFDACGAQFTLPAGKDGFALDLGGSVIAKSVNLRHGFIGKDIVRLNRTHIAANLDCNRGSFGAFYCKSSTIEEDFRWTEIASPDTTFLSLEHTSIGTLSVDSKSKPGKGKFVAIGFSYNHAKSTDVSALNFANERIAWLDRQGDLEKIDPQPWMQLISLLNARGDRGGARRAFLRMRRNQASYSAWPVDIFDPKLAGDHLDGWKVLWMISLPLLFLIRFLRRETRMLFSHLQIQPLWILGPLILVIGFGATIYKIADCNRLIAPTDNAAFDRWEQGKEPRGNLPSFSPLGYSVENTLPVLKMGQADKWIPTASHPKPGVIITYRTVVAVRWLQVLAGWALVGVVTAAIASQFKA